MSPLNTVVLTKNGALRISADLLPENVKKEDLRYSIVGRDQTIELRPLLNGDKSDGLIAKASFSNAGAKSPMVAVRKALGNAGVPLPKKSVTYKVQKRKGGVLVVKFKGGYDEKT